MTANEQSGIYQHNDHPEWGRGIVLPEVAGRTDRFDLSFEFGGHRILMKTFAGKLKPATVTASEAKDLLTKLSARRAARALSKPVRAKGSTTKAPGRVAPVSFDAQLRLFHARFSGGFAGEQFVRLQRTGAKSKKGGLDAALALAARAFVESAFQGSGDEAFMAAADLARSSGLVHPLDGATTLAGISTGQRHVFLAGLQSWILGKGDDDRRFTEFVASFTQAVGPSAKRPSWPLVTVFGALARPTEHVCVKPTAFKAQATLLDLPLDYAPAPRYSVYQQFLEVATETRKRLREAGEQPRDLLDVAAFIWLTLAPQPSAARATKSATVQAD